MSEIPQSTGEGVEGLKGKKMPMMSLCMRRQDACQNGGLRKEHGFK